MSEQDIETLLDGMSTKTEALPVVAWRYIPLDTRRDFVYTEERAMVDLALRYKRNVEPLTDLTTATARISELEAEVERLRADAERWQALKWHWEDERDMGPGGRWWCSILCENKPATPEAAIDQARQAQKGSA